MSVFGKLQVAAILTSFASILLGATTGCAVHYYDRKAGTEHLWGFGHLKMKIPPPNEGVQAVVKGHETLGLDIGGGEDAYGIALGWQRRRQIVVSSNAAVRFEWPNGDFFNVRVGTLPPWATNSPGTKTNAPNKP